MLFIIFAKQFLGNTDIITSNVEKVKLEILGLQATHAQSGSFALVLGEETGKKKKTPYHYWHV